MSACKDVSARRKPTAGYLSRTLNSFLFLSSTTISRDFFFKLSKISDEKKIKTFAVYGLLISGIVSVLLAYFIPSVIDIWYTIGSICIPGILLPVVSSYYQILKINEKLLLFEIITSVTAGFSWFFIRDYFTDSFIFNIEPMIAGLAFSILIHAAGLMLKPVALKQR